eukprot:TRINITY_DN24114_c0_g1_i1.p1 TRINITY_DN24114_c0_g1~~TRINITY_DN24114_c0_g1_i1.p1  ORF type:complete len:239 (+),score=30.56 TRINITY_DN24114_c0_g1_i1:61-777(+)
MAASTCSEKSAEILRQSLVAAVEAGKDHFGVVVLPGSFNPVHSQHVRCLELARSELESQGITVLGGFFQPSSDGYVSQKVGRHWAMFLNDRMQACEIMAEAVGGEAWLHVWRSGKANGQGATRDVQDFMQTEIAKDMTVTVEAFMVCGADFVVRCGGWHFAVRPSMVVCARPGTELPAKSRGSGWYLAEGDTQPLSSTGVRLAIESRQWDRLVQEGCDACVVEFMQQQFQDGKLFMKQ